MTVIGASRAPSNALRAGEMRTIEHGALVADRARAGTRGEQIDDLLRRRQLLRARREGLIDDVDLRRVDGEHAAVAVAAHLRRAFAQARLVAEVAVNRLDGRHPGDHCAQRQRLRAS